MKKIYLFFGSLLLIFVLLGCGGEGNFTLPTDTTLPTGEITTNEDMTTVDGITTQAPTTQVPTTQVPTTDDGGTTTTTPTTGDNEQVGLLDSPTNLTIEGQVLSWTEVANAAGYAVYVDGNFQAEVSTNQYDFSGIVTGYMVFNVRALAFAEENNSNLSLDIVYNVNASSEIAAIETFMQSSGMNVSDTQAFATELVSRGMTATEMQTMMTNMEPVMMKMQNQSSMSDIYPDLHTFMNGMTNIEALVSAFVRVELPNAIQDEIDYFTSLDGTCEYSYEYYDEYSNEVITECYEYYDVSEDIMYLNRLLLFVETYPDEVVESVMVVINYIMRVENTITAQWMADVDTLMQSASPGPFNVNLAISVKNGLITNLKNEMPTLEEFTMFNQTMMTFGSVMLEDNRTDPFTAEKTALQMQMTLELFFDALLQIDANYITKMMEGLDSGNQSDIIVLQLDFINTFIDTHAIELEALNNVYTAEEKEAIFFDLMIASILEAEGFTETEQADILAIIKANIDFTQLLSLQSLTGEAFNDLLDRLDETDYALIYAFYELTLSYSNNYSIIEDDDSGNGFNFSMAVDLDPGQYVVTVHGFSSSDVGDYDFYIYADYGSGDVLLQSSSDTLMANVENEYVFTLTEPATVYIYTESVLDTYGKLSEFSDSNVTQEALVFNALNVFVETMNPLLQDMTDVEYSLFIDTALSIFRTSFYIEEYNWPMADDEIEAVELILDTISNTTPEQLIILQTVMNQIELSDVMTDIYNIYYVNPGMVTPENQDYGMLIEFANLYVDTYDLVGTEINAFITADLLLLDNAAIQTALGITATEAADIKTMMSDYPVNIYNQAMIVKDYDYTNLTTTQIDELQALIYWLDTPYANQTQPV